ncbi:MAG: hypothetical protein HYY79_06280 [Betaproteobacteria bacterium]|nr:hypothetical protein [Betaproteobacteria bacterium]
MDSVGRIALEPEAQEQVAGDEQQCAHRQAGQVVAEDLDRRGRHPSPLGFCPEKPILGRRRRLRQSGASTAPELSGRTLGPEAVERGQRRWMADAHDRCALLYPGGNFG